MRALVIGFGSIGARHSRILSELGLDVACVTRHPECPYPVYRSIDEAIFSWAPDRVVVSTPTNDHAGALAGLNSAGFSGPTLIEKPLFGRVELPATYAETQGFVAYNLRFHPLVQELRNEVQGRSLYNAEFHAGQYLPQWRPDTDYRRSYSAKISDGGGVLRDLSHEIDLAIWLCGQWTRLTALGGHFSDLEIETDDLYSILATGERCPSVVVSINYLERMPSRSIRINAIGLTATLDMVAGTLSINGKTVQRPVDRDFTYRAQLQAFIDLDDNAMCSIEEGVYVTRVISAAQAASAKREWVTP